MSGGHRDTEPGREEQGHCAARGSTKAADGLQLGDAHAHGFDDAPAAEKRPKAIAA